jgi:short-subunit dehydrogenase
MKDRVVVVTGASDGIGAALARELAGRGAKLALVARREKELSLVAGQCGPLALAIVADATSRADVRRAVATTIERHGHIDVWVNNVGRGISRSPSALTDEDLDEMVRFNVKTALYGMQEVLPHFQQRGTGQVINVSSMLGRIPFVQFRAAYSGAKHFLNALTANFRMEVQEKYPGIQFSLVSPGVVATGFGSSALHGGPDSRTLPNAQSAEDVARVIVEVIETRKADAYTFPGAHERVVDYYSGLSR